MLRLIILYIGSFFTTKAQRHQEAKSWLLCSVACASVYLRTRTSNLEPRTFTRL